MIDKLYAYGEAALLEAPSDTTVVFARAELSGGMVVCYSYGRRRYFKSGSECLGYIYGSLSTSSLTQLSGFDQVKAPVEQQYPKLFVRQVADSVLQE